MTGILYKATVTLKGVGKIVMRADLDVRAHLRMYMKCIKLGNTQKWVQAMNESIFVFFFRFSKTTGSVGRWETKHFKGKTFGWSRKTG